MGEVQRHLARGLKRGSIFCVHKDVFEPTNINVRTGPDPYGTSEVDLRNTMTRLWMFAFGSHLDLERRHLFIEAAGTSPSWSLHNMTEDPQSKSSHGCSTRPRATTIQGWCGRRKENTNRDFGYSNVPPLRRPKKIVSPSSGGVLSRTVTRRLWTPRPACPKTPLKCGQLTLLRAEPSS